MPIDQFLHNSKKVVSTISTNLQLHITKIIKFIINSIKVKPLMTFTLENYLWKI